MVALGNKTVFVQALAQSILPAAATILTTGAFDDRCATFADALRSTYANATIWFAEPVAAGTTLALPDYDATCVAQRGDAPVVVGADVCRVALRVPTSACSSIAMEAWLPPAAAWTGRFLSTGNGGLGGCIQYDDLAYAAALGFAAVATNNGHNGTSGLAFGGSGAAAAVVEDFAYRAVRTGVVLGKAIARAFYGAALGKSYFLGCSTGGRQGFKEAQDFPDDFDGWVVGAPALAFINLTSWSGAFFTATGAPDAPTFLAAGLWEAVHADILAQCDGLDGHVDGIIEDAARCRYAVSSALLCRAGAGASACLTDVQADTVRRVFSPAYTDDGSLVFPAMQPGSEDLARRVYYSGAPFAYTLDWFRYAVYNDSDWDPATLSSRDYVFAASQNPYNIQTWKGDLSAVRSRGAKILHYHGQQDPVITSYNSPQYYEHVSKTMGLKSSELDDFYRFFKIGGMDHCTGGPGATFIGQNLASNATLDPDGNVLMSMVRWVEEGIAPDTILGTAYVNRTLASGQVAFQRRHCRYPLTTVYSGSGDPTKADSWTCEQEGVGV